MKLRGIGFERRLVRLSDNVIVRAWDIARRESVRELSRKYDNTHGDDQTDGFPRFSPPVVPSIGRKFGRNGSPRFFAAHQWFDSYFIPLPASVFLSVDCGVLSPSVEHREAIILERTRNSRKKPLLRRGGELMNGGDRRTDSWIPPRLRK